MRLRFVATALVLAGVAACNDEPSGVDTLLTTTTPEPTPTTPTPSPSPESQDVVPKPGAITSLSLASLPLVPAFSPDVHDYAVRCTALTNTLTVSWAPAYAAKIASPTATAATDTSASVTVVEGQAIVVESTDPSLPKASYFVRCLPTDFPTLDVVAHPEVGLPQPGYTLIGTATPAGAGPYAIVLDPHGTPLWFRRQATQTFNVDVAAPGVLSWISTTAPGYGVDPYAGYVFQKLVDDSTTSVATVGMPTDLHDVLVRPDGHRFLLSYPEVSGVDLTGLRTWGPGSTIVDCAIQELDAAGALVWQWRAIDHVDPVTESTFPTARVDGARTIVDPYHCNSIEIAPSGDVLVSARHLDAVWSISKATGKVVWKLGGARVSKDGAKILDFTNDGGFFRQHDARLLPSGDLSIFDNETAMPSPGRGVVYHLDLVAGTATRTFEVKNTVPAAAMGSFRPAGGDHWIVGWGFPSSGNLAYSEVDAAGRSVLDVSLGDGQTTYRAIKVPESALPIDVLRARGGLAFEAFPLP